MSLDLSYHKEHQYIRFRGGESERFLRYRAFYEPNMKSLDASYHKEHEYIWFIYMYEYICVLS